MTEQELISTSWCKFLLRNATLKNAFAGDYFLDEATIQMAYQPPHQVNAIHAPSALKIDFWMLRPVAFERETFARKLRHEIFGETAWIATPEDVILHKLYWNQITPSDRQLQDAAGVVSVQRGRLDQPYLRHREGSSQRARDCLLE